jgi:hypothetical protein
VEQETGKTFINQTVRLDGTRFEDCAFHGCTLVFRGEQPVHIVGCRLEDVKWRFDGPARHTLQFLSQLYQGTGEGGRRTVEATFESIRLGHLPSA